MDNKDKDFTGYIVHCEHDIENINGRKVIKTNKWLKCGNPNSTLYEVKLDNNRLYQLYECEMVKE
jgi:hypothetical protein